MQYYALIISYVKFKGRVRAAVNKRQGPLNNYYRIFARNEAICQ